MNNIDSLYELTDILIDNATFDRPMSKDDIIKHLVCRTGIRIDAAKERVEAFISECLDVPLVLGAALRQCKEGYFIELPLSATDISVLRSMLLSLPYCERWQLSQMYNRLESFLPEYMRDEDSVVYTNAEKYNGTFYENMDEIIRALYPASGRIRKISFDYCGYNESLELEMKASRFNGQMKRIADPIKVVCVNDFFYLVAFYNEEGEIKFINYRIDRMKNVVCMDEPAERFEELISEKRRYILELKRNIEKGRREAKHQNRIYHEPNDDISALDEARRIDSNGFNLGEYIFRSKIMYTDKMVDKVRVKLDKSTLNGVIDLFGFDVDVYPSDEQTIFVDIHNVTEMTVIKWALQFFESVEIIEPASLRKTMAEKISLLTEKYK